MTTTTFVIGALAVSMIAVLGILATGLIVMVRGKDVTGKQTNKLMWLRVYGQAIALALFALVLILTKKNGG